MLTSVTKDEFFQSAVQRLCSTHTVLDIGPGIRPQQLVNAKVSVCVEPCTVYADVLATDYPDYVVLNCTWAEALRFFRPDSIDTVVLLDVIEHWISMKVKRSSTPQSALRVVRLRC
ncbi:hypothetical protein EG829_27250 [bacterium]|nr:hypothetical protein [bacterium]